MTVVATLLLTSALLAAPPVLDTCAGGRLPGKLRDVLVGRFPGWRLVTVNDLHRDDQVIWLTDRGQECPGIAIGRFQSARRVSYGLLLIRADRERLLERLVVVQSAGSKGYHVTELVGPTETARPSVIFRAPPGVITSWDQSERVRIQNDAIVHAVLEARVEAFYWHAGIWRSIRTSD
ncbi:MAG TPA: hypothetical protein VFN71_15365 [Methylomirabilota bacterium]|nr:hypothetical protein [Methylomirabilota bacterium]